MLFISGFLLLYTATVVPVQMFLWDYSDPCNKFPTLFFDVIVDCFFVVCLPARASAPLSASLIFFPGLSPQLEVASQFFIGHFDNSETYFDDMKMIMIRNFTSISGFWFDLVTSIPWSYLDVNAYKVKHFKFAAVYDTARTHISYNYYGRTVFQNLLPGLFLAVYVRVQACIEHLESPILGSETKIFRIVKILRMLKIIRLLKAVKVVE